MQLEMACPAKRTAHLVAKIHTIKKLHRDIETVISFTKLEDLSDVRMRHLSRKPRLIDKHLPKVVIRRVPAQRALQRHVFHNAVGRSTLAFQTSAMPPKQSARSAHNGPQRSLGSDDIKFPQYLLCHNFEGFEPAKIGKTLLVLEDQQLVPCQSTPVKHDINQEEKQTEESMTSRAFVPLDVQDIQ